MKLLCVGVLVSVASIERVQAYDSGTPTYVFKGVGISVEAKAVAVHSMSDAYQLLVYHIAPLQKLQTDGNCSYVLINSSKEHLVQPVWNLLDGYESLTTERLCKDSPLLCDVVAPAMHRQKRFAFRLVGAVSGFLGVGMAVRNGVQIKDIHQASIRLAENQVKISAFLKETDYQMKYRIHDMERLVISRAEEARHNLGVLNDYVCHMQEAYARAFLQLSTRVMIDEVFDIVSRAQEGFIDPRMVPPAPHPEAGARGHERWPEQQDNAE